MADLQEAAAPAEDVEAFVAAADAHAPGGPEQGVLRADPDAEYANQLLRQGIQISPGVVGLSSERIVEHYG